MIRALPRLLLCLLCLSTLAHADLAPGAEDYIASATLIQLVEAPPADIAATMPVGPNEQWVLVTEVLKGISTKQIETLPAGSLPPGSKGLALHLFEAVNCQPTAESPAPKPRIVMWPLNLSGKLNTSGLPRKRMDDLALKRINLNKEEALEKLSLSLAEVRNDIVEQAPEEAGLNQRVMSLLLSDDTPPPADQAGVHMIMAIRNVNRDVRTLAPLLESRDASVRRQAAAQLQKISGTHVPEPEGASPAALHAWAEAWMKHESPRSSPSTRWPAVPASLQLPPDNYGAPLLRALERKDAAEFTKEFSTWLHSGAMRDRLILEAQKLNRDQWTASHLELTMGGGAYLPPAPRVRPDVIFTPLISVEDRLKIIALLAAYYHRDDFSRERQEAAQYLQSAEATLDDCRRAAFWDLDSSSISNPHRIALRKLSEAPQNDDDQRFLLFIFLNRSIGGLDLARTEIQKNRTVFIDGLLAYLKTHRDETAGWIGRLLCQEKKPAVVPLLTEHLKDPTAKVRQIAALDLCWQPHPDAVAPLLEALSKETDAEAKKEMLIALAQQIDTRALKPLMDAAAQPDPPDEVVRGLGRLRDPAALPVLAKLATDLPTGSVSDHASIVKDAVISFGYIARWPNAREPDAFWSSSGITDEEIQNGVRRIQEWRKK